MSSFSLVSALSCLHRGNGWKAWVSSRSQRFISVMSQPNLLFHITFVRQSHRSQPWKRLPGTDRPTDVAALFSVCVFDWRFSFTSSCAWSPLTSTLLGGGDCCGHPGSIKSARSVILCEPGVGGGGDLKCYETFAMKLRQGKEYVGLPQWR